jgi:glycosyltransferase involved in cell wall biosynthesis
VAVRRRVLILSLYFRPDLSAGSFRATSLVEALLESAPDIDVDVITTLPNRYGSFSVDAPEEEQWGRCRIWRIRLPSHRSGMADQTKAFVTFARMARRRTRGIPYDLVFATSSRLMTAALGASIARRARAPLFLDIRDIFTETIGDVLKGRRSNWLRPVFDRLEAWTIESAVHVNLVSPGFEPYFRPRYPNQSYSFLTNGIDEEFLAPRGDSHTIRESEPRAPKRVVYAGNMGEGQGLHAIIPALAKRLEGRAVFKLIGDGGRRRHLEEALRRAEVSTVEIVAPMPRDRLIAEYERADILFLHLNDYDAFRRVLPSKVFEYGAMAKPVWAGVSGYAAEFLRAELPGAGVFEPCDVEGGLAAFDSLGPAGPAPATFVQKFRRRTIMRTMATELLARMKSRDTA